MHIRMDRTTGEAEILWSVTGGILPAVSYPLGKRIYSTGKHWDLRLFPTATAYQCATKIDLAEFKTITNPKKTLCIKLDLIHWDASKSLGNFMHRNEC